MTGYTKAQGIAASLRQQADWMDRLDDDVLDPDELRFAADYIDALELTAKEGERLCDIIERTWSVDPDSPSDLQTPPSKP